MLTVAAVKSLLTDSFPDSEIKVVDLTGTSDHFGVDITSTRFEGLNLIQQHKLVHSAVGSHLTNEIHALDIKTRTPE
jgi:stress-induced morphogen